MFFQIIFIDIKYRKKLSIKTTCESCKKERRKKRIRDELKVKETKKDGKQNAKKDLARSSCNKKMVFCNCSIHAPRMTSISLRVTNIEQ